MRRTRILMVSSLSLLIGGPARAAERGFEDLLRGDDYIIDQQPHPTGGPGADSEFVGMSGLPAWQLVADDFHLFVPASVRQITWWGFYGGVFDESPEPPPLAETICFRFYGSRPDDGLPGDLLFEAFVTNHARRPTGREIQDLVTKPEYIFQAQLPAAAHLTAGPHWFAITQLGDIDSHFRWEFSVTNPDGFAFLNQNVADWTTTQLNANVAFVLSNVPEPATGVVVVLLGGIPARVRRRWSMN